MLIGMTFFWEEMLIFSSKSSTRPRNTRCRIVNACWFLESGHGQKPLLDVLQRLHTGSLQRPGVSIEMQG
jgi:hypothetical protein